MWTGTRHNKNHEYLTEMLWAHLWRYSGTAESYQSLRLPWHNCISALVNDCTWSELMHLCISFYRKIFYRQIIDKTIASTTLQEPRLMFGALDLLSIFYDPVQKGNTYLGAIFSIRMYLNEERNVYFIFGYKSQPWVVVSGDSHWKKSRL